MIRHLQFNLSTRSIRHTVFGFFLFLNFIASAGVSALAQSPGDQFVAAHRDFFRLYLSDPSEIALGYGYEPGGKASSGAGRYELQKYWGGFELPVARGRDEFLRFGADYGARRYRFRAESARILDQRSEVFHKARLAFGAGRFFGDNLLLTGIVRPAAYSDFGGRTRQRDFQLQAEALAVYRMHPATQFLIGVSLSEDFDDYPVYPLVGLRVLSEDGRIHLSLSAPLEARIGYRAYESVEFFAAGSISGERYRARFGGAPFDVRIEDRRIGAGALAYLGRHFLLSFEGGVFVDSSLEFKTERFDVFSGRRRPGAYFEVGLGVSL